MPIGTGIIYNVGDLILGTVSGSGTAFLETKIAAATSSIVYFDSNARINSASLNSITVGTASYVSGSTSIITNLTASNISASGTGSFGIVGIGTTVPSAKLEVANTGRILGVLRLHITPQTTFYDNTFAVGTDGGGANGFIYTSGTGGAFPLDFYGELILQSSPKTGYNNGISLVTGTTSPSVKLRIAEGGNVGIGTTSPGALLHVYTGSIGGTAYPLLIDNNSGGAGVNVVGFGFANGGIMKHSITTAIYGNDYMAFNVGQGASYNQERMRIDSGGAVGIGTTTVSRILHAYVTTGPVMRVQSSGSNASIEFIPSIGHNRYNWLIGAQQNISDAFEITPSTATNGTTFTTPAILVASSGNIGIGTTSPTQRLDLSGSLRIQSTGTYSDPADNAGFINYDSTGGIFTFSARSNGGNTYMAFRTSNAGTAGERMRIINDGNVGIGTTAPGRKLDVVGTTETSIRVADTGGSSLELYQQVTDSYLLTTNALRIYTSGSARMSILNNGNVGIGRTSPQQKLHIAGTNARLAISNDSDNNWAEIGNDGSSGQNTLEFFTGTSVTPAMSITNDNNVGIGTSSPVAALDVSRLEYPSLGGVLANFSAGTTDPTTEKYVILKQTYTGAAYDSPMLVFRANANSANSGSFGIVRTTSNGSIVFSNVNATSGTVTAVSEKMRITADGIVGIGTSSPNSWAKLEVNGTTAVNGILYINENYNIQALTSFPGSAGKLILNSFGGNVGIGTNTPGALLEISSSTAASLLNIKGAGGSGLLFVSGSGNVGIGTTSPTDKLSVIVSAPATLASTSDGLRITDGTRNVQLSRLGSTYSYAGVAGSGSMLYSYDKLNIVADTSNPIIFNTGGSERVRIDSSGSVLIGVNGAYNSSRLLQVKDGLLIGNSFYTFASIDTSGTADLILTSNANPANLGSNSNIIFKLGTSAGGGPDEKMRIVSNGNVGIGTSNPSSSLHVYGTTPTIKVQGSSTASAKVELIGTYTTWSLENQYINGANNDMFRIYNSALSADAITINRATNNVGIGATNPTAKLHIQSGSILVKGAATPGLNLEPSGVVGNADISFDGTSFILVSNSNSADLRLSTSSTPRLTILASGDVGIGTTSPGYKLDVTGTSPIIRVLATSGNSTLRLTDNGVRNWDLKVVDVSDYFEVGGTDAPSLVVTGAGNVGIGTTSPTAKLDVSGTSFLRGDLNAGKTANLNITTALNGTGGGNRGFDTSFTGASATGFTGSDDTDQGFAYFAATIISGRSYEVSATMVVTNGAPLSFRTSTGLNFATQTVQIIIDPPVSNTTYSFVATADAAFFGIGINRTSGTMTAVVSNVSVKEVGSVLVASNSNVGIGTTSPASKLSIVGSAAATNFKSLILRNGDGTVGSAVSIDFETSAGTIGDEASMAARISGIRLGSGTAGGLVFATTDGGNLGERVRILNNGAVGIGTTSPSLISGYIGLNVVNTGYTQIKLQSSASSAGIEFKPSSGNSWELQANNSNQWFVYDRTQDVYRLIIDGNGNVGIGATPIAPLDVQCNTGGTGIIIRGRADNSTALRFYANNGTTQQLYIGTDDSNIDFDSVSTRPIRFFVNDLLQYQISQLGVFSWKDGAGGDRMRLNSTGLGIGTTNPLKNLQINAVTASIRLEETGAGSKRLELSIDDSAVAKISANQSGQQIAFETVGTERIRIAADGNVGIGTSSPLQKLHVLGNISTIAQASSGDEASRLQFYNIGAATYDIASIRSFVGAGQANRGELGFYVNNGASQQLAMYIDRSQNIGIGTTSPLERITFASSDSIIARSSATDFNSGYCSRILFNQGGTGYGYLGFYTYQGGTGGGERMRIAENGNVGIGTTAPAAKLEISGSSNSALLNIKSPISGAILFVSGSGAVGINTSTVGAYTLQVNGSFAATTKSFIIDHPTKAGKKLIYGSLESPYHGIRLTGRDTLKEGKCKVELPDYIYKLILHDSVNIQLTGIKCNKTLYVDEINIPENYFTIAYDNAIFESYKDYDFFWDFTGIRTDVPELITEL